MPDDLLLLPRPRNLTPTGRLHPDRPNAHPAGVMGRAAFDLGNVYRATGVEPPNSSALFWMLRWPLELVRGYRDTVPPETLHLTLETIDRAIAPLAGANSQRLDAALLHREFAMTARLLRHACRRRA